MGITVHDNGLGNFLRCDHRIEDIYELRFRDERYTERNIYAAVDKFEEILPPDMAMRILYIYCRTVDNFEVVEWLDKLREKNGINRLCNVPTFPS